MFNKIFRVAIVMTMLLIIGIGVIEITKYKYVAMDILYPLFEAETILGKMQVTAMYYIASFLMLGLFVMGIGSLLDSFYKNKKGSL
ncbi:MAG: Unknown protein [uncultured Sulfurovum sp.]|uniref:Uncharacterized protein n=1 Tax=uncultured Sulfurovum sp. TaxID=269237 RepID=A0A6S6SR97_9BACT|nr:MAG: Unknown protein [uncultured Sulfurovum sp.]